LSLRIREEILIVLIRSIDFPVRTAGVKETAQGDAICRHCGLQEIVMDTHTARSLLQLHGMQTGSTRGNGLLASSLDAIKSVARALLQWQRQRRDILELQRMDDRLLADIGITRGEADHMVRNGRWGQAALEPDAAFPATDRKRSAAMIWDKELGKRA
jgi:uncharacterized protein YjiS (DUF1127 family)